MEVRRLMVVMRVVNYSSTFLLAACVFSVNCTSKADWTISTIAGNGSSKINKVQSPLATNVGNPFGVEIGPDGAIYVCEVSNHRMLRLDIAANSIAVVAGTGQKGYSGDGGAATKASLNEPYEVRFAKNGDMYFVEMQNNIVRKVSAKTRIISTVAGNGERGFGGDGGKAIKAKLNRPHSIALNEDSLFIADIGNHRIRRVDLHSGDIESIAGTTQKKLPTHGSPTKNQPVLGPRALFLQGSTLWVALREGHSIWNIDLAADRWHHVAGTGQRGFSGDGGNARKATLNGPKGIAVGKDGKVFVVDTENQAIRVIDPSTNMIVTLAGAGPTAQGFRGDGMPANSAWLNRPHGVCLTADGRVVIGDSENHRVRMVTPVQNQ